MNYHYIDKIKNISNYTSHKDVAMCIHIGLGEVPITTSENPHFGFHSMQEKMFENQGYSL